MQIAADDHLTSLPIDILHLAHGLVKGIFDGRLHLLAKDRIMAARFDPQLHMISDHIGCLAAVDKTNVAGALFLALLD